MVILLVIIDADYRLAHRSGFPFGTLACTLGRNLDRIGNPQGIELEAGQASHVSAHYDLLWDLCDRAFGEDLRPDRDDKESYRDRWLLYLPHEPTEEQTTQLFDRIVMLGLVLGWCSIRVAEAEPTATELDDLIDLTERSLGYWDFERRQWLEYELRDLSAEEWGY